MENKQIYKSIPAIIADVKGIAKSHKNTFQGYMFRGIDDVYNAVNELLAKHKVSIYPKYEIISEVIGETKKGGEQKTVVIKGIYKLVAEDGSFEEVITIGEAADTSDKAYNKAMSTAFKYALFQVFCIPTEEEKDTEAKSPEVTTKKKTEHKLETKKEETKQTVKAAEYTRELAIEAFKQLPDDKQQEIIDKFKSYNDMTDGQIKITYHKYCL